MGKKKRVHPADTIFGTPFNRKVKNPLSIGLSSLYPKSKQPTKDSRRSFGSDQRKKILYQQDNKCAVCHEKLDPRAIHFHHAKPWSSGGRTIVANGRALCPKCHEILSHEERLKKTDKKRKPKNETPFSIL